MVIVLTAKLCNDLGGATVSTIASAIMQDAGMPQERLNEVIQAKRKLSYELIPTESKLLPTFDCGTSLLSTKAKLRSVRFKPPNY